MTYVSLVIAIVALLLAAGSVVVAYLTDRHSGPQVRLKIDYVMESPGGVKTMDLQAVNWGRAAVDLQGFSLVPPRSLRRHPQLLDITEGQGGLARLDGGATRHFRLELSRTAVELINDPRTAFNAKRAWLPRHRENAYIRLTLGDGREVRSRPFSWPRLLERLG